MGYVPNQSILQHYILLQKSNFPIRTSDMCFGLPVYLTQKMSVHQTYKRYLILFAMFSLFENLIP